MSTLRQTRKDVNQALDNPSFVFTVSPEIMRQLIFKQKDIWKQIRQSLFLSLYWWGSAISMAYPKSLVYISDKFSTLQMWIVHPNYLGKPIWPGPPRVGKGFPRLRAKCRYISAASIMVAKEGRRPHKYRLRLQGLLKVKTETNSLFWTHWNWKARNPYGGWPGPRGFCCGQLQHGWGISFSRCWPWNHGMPDSAACHQTATHWRLDQLQG